MDQYKIMYVCNDGYEGEEIVCAVNRCMAFEIFKSFGIENVAKIDCVRISYEEEN